MWQVARCHPVNPVDGKPQLPGTATAGTAKRTTLKKLLVTTSKALVPSSFSSLLASCYYR